jgi:hypothetical protein
MIKEILLIVLLAALSFSTTQRAENPHAKITNGIIDATLYLPDSENGYYRGTRFDWAGQISDLRYKRHTYFGQWFDKYDPYLHDAIMGPVEAFDPLGYDKAPTGGSFVKIGIGALLKPEEKEYLFANEYKALDYGEWKTNITSDHVIFTHTLKDTGYSYIYKKTVQLVPGEPVLELIHSLKNTGKKTIETNVMNHNFFVIDTQVTSSNFVVEFPFEVGGRRELPNASNIEGNKIIPEDGHPKGKNFYVGDISGYRNNPADYNITVSNKKTGAAVNIKADKPFSKLAFWATVKTICPEPFIHVKAEPGKTFTWKITYRFRVNAVQQFQ